jgi:hypothetical protein
MVATEARQRTGSRTEKGRSYHCRSCPWPKVRRCGESVVEALQTNYLTRHEGEHRGGTPPPREVFPLDWPASRLLPGQLRRLERDERIRQLPVVVQVAARRPRAASMPPAWWSHRRSGRQEQHRGVSDHPEWPVGLPSLRPAMWSLTPPLEGLLATRASSVSPVEAWVNSTRNLREILRRFLDALSLWSRLFDRNG